MTSSNAAEKRASEARNRASRASSAERLSLAQKYAALDSEKRRLFRQRLNDHGIDGASLPMVPIANRPRRLPLSHAQERLWFLWRLDPGSAAYNIGGAIRLKGVLDAVALRSALSGLVARHESLRTRFEEVDGVACQVIGHSGAYGFEDASLGEEELGAHLNAFAGRPFDLEAGPLLRAALVRLEDAEHVLALSMHHIISDGWSIGILVKEFVALYEAALSGSDAGLAALPIQYGDYALWQREWLDEAGFAGQLDYWRGRLGTEHPVLSLPYDRQRTAQRSSAGGRVSRVLAGPVLSGLRQLSQGHEASLFMSLLAAFDVLLYRYSGQVDIRVGVPVSGRQRLETEGLIGFFVNTLVLQADLAGSMTFGELLKQTRDRVLEAQGHQDLPFARLVEALQPERQLGQTPLFQVMFNLQQIEGSGLALPGLEVSGVSLDAGTAQFDLTLDVTEAAEELRLSFDYACDLFDRETIERLAGHYVEVLEQLADANNKRLGEIALSVEASQHQELKSYSFEPVTDRIAKAAAVNPAKVAVRCEGAELSYGELERWSNRLGRVLRAQGIGRDDRVGLCVERSLGLVAGLLGILKSGGAYVPLDPSYPVERLAGMIADAGIKVVVSDKASASRLSELLAGQAVVLVDELGEVDDSAIVLTVHPGQLAYVIYTSGSTGKPKGVGVTQANLSRLLTATEGWYSFGPDDVWTLFHSYAFDFSVWEVFGALAHGGRLVVVPYWTARTPDAFHQLLVSEGVTVLNQTPSAFQPLMQVDLGAERKLERLRAVIFGGEKLEPAMLATWLAARGETVPALINMYGITETTVHVTYRPLSTADITGPRVKSVIGVPIPDLSLSVLDGDLNPVPVGAVGELYVGGAGLARGYLNRPDLTAERFIPDPQGRGGRLYRSGDLARRLADGDIEYIGRNDFQVKVRGYRIELGEIEAALLREPGVEAAVVIARDDHQGGKRLIAYIVGNVDLALLRESLEARLLVHMVPGHLQALEKLPLTVNGKVDRGQLPDVVAQTSDYVAPVSPTEQALAKIWAEVLGLDQIGTNDNFFELGGHSLSAVRVVLRIRQVLKRESSLRMIFETPTLARLATALEALPELIGEPEIWPRPVGRDHLPLSHAQERLWFLWRLDPGSAAYNIGGAIRLKGVLDAVALRSALSGLVARHESLRTRFEEVDGVACQVIGHSGAYGFEDASLGEEELGAHLNAFAGRPFDLEAGPLLRAALVRLEDAEHVLALSMHHIISDGWSIGILVKEFVALYEAALSGSDAGLAALPIQYGDYALWQREWLDEAGFAGQLDYWRGRLGTEHPVLSLPYDRQRTAQRSSAGGRVSRVLAGPVLSGLRQLSQGHEASLFMSLLAAFDVLLYRYSGQVDIRVGVPVSGRQRLETEGLIGFFVNTLVLQADLAGSMTFGELLKQTRDRVLEAQGHQDLPFARLVEALQPERQLGQTPLFQVMFNLQQIEGSGLALPGLEVSGVSLDAGTAQFDLTLDVTEAAEELRLSFDYACDLFDRETIERLAGHYVEVLEQLADANNKRLGEIALSVEASQHQELKSYSFEPVTDRIAKAAAVNPAKVAVRCEGAELSYGELERWSNRLGRVLRAQGIGRDDRVGLCVERSLGLVAGLLGILKSGGAYVPLDPSYPVERLAGMIADAGIKVVVSDKASASRLSELLAGQAVVLVDELGEVDDSAIVLTVHPGQLAYVIYTSGSTGKPKGVGVSHKSLSLHLDDFIGIYSIDAADTVLQYATINFDSATEQLLPPLCVGGSLLLRGELLWDHETFNEIWRQNGVTFADLPTAFWQTWVRDLPDDPGTLRCVTVGGEALAGDGLAHWFSSAFKDIRFDNTYGPTEATVTMLRHQAIPSDIGAPTVALGTRYPGRTAYIIDQSGNRVPTGAFGELCIGGDSLARGYLERPGLTAERFVPDPFGVLGSRLYRTGDLCRQRSDGVIDFFGRMDQQVKLRGIRIELGEVEAALRHCPGVREAIVSLVTMGGEKYLIGYAVGDMDPAEVKQQLAKALPTYMVPAIICQLDTLPLMPNGKLDRAALPQPHFTTSAIRVEPRSPLEMQLFAIWKDVLQRDDFGITDSFFDLGGNSLMALRAGAAAKRDGLESFSLEGLFITPTIAALAQSLERAASSAGLLALNETVSDQKLFCIHAGYGLVNEYRSIAEALSGRVSVIGVQSPIFTDPDWNPASFEEMAEDYADRLQSVQAIGPYYLLGWSLGGEIAVSVARCLEKRGEGVAFLGLIDTITDLGSLKDDPDAVRADEERIAAYFNASAKPDADMTTFAEKAVSVIRRYGQLLDGHKAPVVAASINVWWSGETKLKRPASAFGWQRFTTSSFDDVIVSDATHTGIVQHQVVIEALQGWFAADAQSMGTSPISLSTRGVDLVSTP